MKDEKLTELAMHMYWEVISTRLLPGKCELDKAYFIWAEDVSAPALKNKKLPIIVKQKVLKKTAVIWLQNLQKFITQMPLFF